MGGGASLGERPRGNGYSEIPSTYVTYIKGDVEPTCLQTNLSLSMDRLHLGSGRRRRAGHTSPNNGFRATPLELIVRCLSQLVCQRAGRRTVPEKSLGIGDQALCLCRFRSVAGASKSIMDGRTCTTPRSVGRSSLQVV